MGITIIIQFRKGKHVEENGKFYKNILKRIKCQFVLNPPLIPLPKESLCGFNWQQFTSMAKIVIKGGRAPKNYLRFIRARPPLITKDESVQLFQY
jgi:hypothetical protein